MNRVCTSALLLKALRQQIKKDLYGERAILFESLLKDRRAKKIIYRLVDQSHLLRSLCCALYGLGISMPDAAFGSHAALVGQGSESKFLKRLIKTAPGLGLVPLDFSRWRFRLALTATSAKNILRFWRLISRMNKAYPLYVAIRATQVLISYSALRNRLRHSRPRSLTIFSEGNPHALAAWAAASVQAIPVIFIAHAPMITNPARLSFRMAVVYGKESELAFKRAGAAISEYMHFGWLRPQANGLKCKKICVSLSKDVSLPFLERTLKVLAENFPAPVIVRAHPNSLVSPSSINRILKSGAILSRNELEDDLNSTFLHLAGNSTVHLESLARGISTVYLSGIDHTGRFPISIIREKLIPEITLDQLGSKDFMCPAQVETGPYLSTKDPNLFRVEIERFYSEL